MNVDTSYHGQYREQTTTSTASQPTVNRGFENSFKTQYIAAVFRLQIAKFVAKCYHCYCQHVGLVGYLVIPLYWSLSG